MTKNFKMTLVAVLALAAAAVVPSFVSASGNAPSGSTAVTAKARINSMGNGGYPLSNAAKGAKVFGVDPTATLVTDEALVAPTAGALASLEIGINGAATAVAQCYLLVYDSSVASDTTEANSVSRLLVPPLIAVTSSNQIKEFSYPKQFHKGLVVLTGGTGAQSCRASITWLKNGGAN